jgi:hypothetical protein
VFVVFFLLFVCRYVSTPSRSQYQALGKLIFKDEHHFFNLPSRTASVSHAEAKHYSSRDVDSLLQQSTANLPAIAAGGVRSEPTKKKQSDKFLKDEY